MLKVEGCSRSVAYGPRLTVNLQQKTTIAILITSEVHKICSLLPAP
ncbi:hypothetical protein [Moorena sp. SIO4G3]|nr:hypothetical protein [Moorena sp. SIO4G3]NEO74761.1 hypothetical protein [Moorena sp. SIO4G3]